MLLGESDDGLSWWALIYIVSGTQAHFIVWLGHLYVPEALYWILCILLTSEGKERR